MTLRDLEIFLEVANTKNMSKAGENLHISQPTVSHAIAQIEKEFNVVLFERVSKSLFLSDAGYKLYHSSKKLLKDFEDISLELLNTSLIKIGISEDVPLDLIEKFKRNLENKYDICLKFVLKDSNVLKKLFENNELDCLFLGENLLSSKDDLDFIDLNFVLCTKKENLSLSPHNLKFISWSNSYPIKVLKALKEKYILDTAWESSSLDSVLKLLELGPYFTFLPEIISKNYEIISDINFKKRFILHYKKDKFITKEFKILLNEFKSIKENGLVF